jgi:RimJ/RimL family protein N-acetyltransferase
MQGGDLMKMLQTDRLRLRPATPDDAEFIFELMNDDSYQSQIGDRGVDSVEAAANYIRTAALYAYGPEGFGFNIVETSDGGEKVGICGLVKREALEDVDLGYAILSSHSRRGFASEAAAATLDHAKGELGLPRVVAITTVSNAGSRRVLEKIGMRLDKVIQMEGADKETCLYAA